MIGTSGTANLIHATTSLNISELKHGPSGGDIQIAFHIIEGNIDMLLFFQDISIVHSHENDIQSLIRACINSNIPFALNSATADVLINEEVESGHTDDNEKNNIVSAQHL